MGNCSGVGPYCPDTFWADFLGDLLGRRGQKLNPEPTNCPAFPAILPTLGDPTDLYEDVIYSHESMFNAKNVITKNARSLKFIIGTLDVFSAHSRIGACYESTVLTFQLHFTRCQPEC